MSPRLAAAAALALSGSSCTAILGDYQVAAGGPAGCTAETEKEDCSQGKGCDETFGGVCRLFCGDTNPCPAYRECSGHFCSEAVGTPCVSGEDCGSLGDCVDHDTNGAKLEQPYCSASCSASDMDPCPADYECSGSQCVKL